MRKFAMAALVALIGLVPLVPAQAQPAVATATETSSPGALDPSVLGLGAVAGVAVYNMAALGVSGVPFLGLPVTTGAMVTARAVAQNRLYTVLSAVGGAWVLNWLYGN